MPDKEENKYPLHPELTEQGEKEAQEIMDSFKPRLKKMMDEALGDLYCDVTHYIESDSWSNFRTSIFQGIRNYKMTGEDKLYPNELKSIRDAVYRDHKEEIIKDLNQDLIDENARLEETIKTLHAHAQRHY